jgi:hypothetical protein
MTHPGVRQESWQRTGAGQSSCRARRLFRRARLCALGRQRSSDGGGMGIRRTAGKWIEIVSRDWRRDQSTSRFHRIPPIMKRQTQPLSRFVARLQSWPFLHSHLRLFRELCRQLDAHQVVANDLSPGRRCHEDHDSPFVRLSSRNKFRSDGPAGQRHARFA